MIVLEGQPALSQFRRARLESRLQSVAPQVRLLGTWQVYFIDPQPGTAPDLEALRRILQAGDTPAAQEDGATSRLVVPRLGTRSPWSSKATELLRGAGIAVHRVERGTRVDLAGWPDDAGARAALDKLLHDPMTSRCWPASSRPVRCSRRRRAARWRGCRWTRWKRPTRASAWPWCRTRSTTCARATRRWGATRPTSS